MLQDGVVQVTGSDYAFAAIKADGSVVTGANSAYGGDSSSVASLPQDRIIQATGKSSSFAAIKADGSVVTWGDSWYGVVTVLQLQWFK